MPLPFNTSFVRLLINNTQYQYKSFTDKNHQKIEASFHPTFSKKLEAIINIIILPHFLIITFRITAACLCVANCLLKSPFKKSFGVHKYHCPDTIF